MHFKLRLRVSRLNRLRLRLGFDLFSHSFHNLIKKTSLVLHGEQKKKLRNQRLSATKEISPFMAEG
jgi:hypothetical protein